MAFFILGQELPHALGRTGSPALAALAALAGTGLILGAARLWARRQAGARRDSLPVPAAAPDSSDLVSRSMAAQPIPGGSSS
jgi:hypothetical protein